MAIGLAAVLSIVLWAGTAQAAPLAMLDGNLQVVDLSDLIAPLPLSVNSTTQILWRTQDWEHSSYKNPIWPSGGESILGYPSVVKNTLGQNPDGKYYLYYAHHDPMSGIGCAVANSITGPYIKISPTDSKVLTVPNYNPAGPNPDDPSHYSTPSVVWNEDTGLWNMYFHYFNHFHGAWTASPEYPGEGWQMTGLATTPDLSSNNWTIYKDPSYGSVSVWDIVPVHQSTNEDWAKLSSSYNAVQQLPDGTWLAFCRGTKSNGMTELGFATSTDGKHWGYMSENPVIHKDAPWSPQAADDVYRPKFIGYLGKNGEGKDEYLVAWSETDGHASIIYGKTTDFITFERDSRGYVNWGGNTDGMVSAWREGDKLYLFSGQYVYTMDLSGVIPEPALLPGDVDGDNDVDIFDWSIFQVAYGQTEGMDWSHGDFDGDGDVDIFDWSIFQPNYGTSRAGDPLPEPAALSLLALCCLAMIRHVADDGRPSHR
ncbi:MAG: hypothetical protein HQ559_11070 [Lentisphaerae bacterium]|nr:hypothetical protein [Lentisphaerota bacterium]